MKVLACVVTYNCAEFIPFWLRHYATICDEIWAWDDHSTDETGRILSSWPKVKVNDWPYPGSGINENLFLDFAYQQIPKMTDFDWCIWVDHDEIVYHPEILNVLSSNLDRDVIRTCGFNMIAENGVPPDYGRQIWEILPMGVKAPVYSKPIVFNPRCEIRWDRGKHHLESRNGKATPHSPLKLLHYRYLGADYTAKRNKQNYNRCDLEHGDKGAAWSCSEAWKGEGSVEWFNIVKNDAFNVLNADYYDAPLYNT